MISIRFRYSKLPLKQSEGLIKLPLKMKTIVEQILKKNFPDQKFLFKTIYIKGLMDENNVETLEIMKPRFVHIYGVDEAELNKTLFLCKKLLGDAFSFEVSEGYTLPDESEEVSISLHERSRILSAVDFCRVFEKQTVEENIQYMLKSTILLTVNRYVLKGSPDAYTCDLNIRPTIATLTPPDQGRIAFSSPYTAIETSLKTDEYETLVDKYFDSVSIAFNDRQTEFVAPDTTQELLNVAKKVVLGETYNDEFETIKEY